MPEEQVSESVVPVIVETVAVSANVGATSLGGGKKLPIAKFYERAIAAAVAEAQEAGVTDAEELRAIILKARDAAKAHVKALLEKGIEG